MFLSCSERFKLDVAVPVRSGLAEHGIRGIILSEEPLLPGTSSDPDHKVESYLDASDAFVALCTPDDELSDGTVQTRQNIIDEIQRAAQKPHLRSRIQVFRAPSVRLPSNINPVYQPLDVDRLDTVVDAVVRQLDTWGVLAKPKAVEDVAPSEPPVISAEALIQGIDVGDVEKARVRVFVLLRAVSRATQVAVVAALREFLRSSSLDEENAKTLAAGLILEIINQFDLTLVDLDLVEELARSEDFSARSIAATMLWDRAEVAPADVPLGLLGRLLRPADEDWYVQAPAMAAAKLLMLRRRSARILFDTLAGSEETDDRYTAATALRDVASVDPLAVPRDLAERLARDPDDLVAAQGGALLGEIGEPPDRDPLSPFRLGT